jgi:2-polyprenyl-6-methoxyphenol hydroxylase-like FAD-dependent oxidoreductase
MAIAVLGGGILGVCTALELADRGYRVVLFERNSELVSEASLHNEGKLHLGFVYAADPSFRTAQRMIDGASRFMATLRRWVPEAGIQALPARPFDYVVHRETMTTVCQIEAHFARVAGSVEKLRREQPLAGACDPARPPWRRLDDDELAARYSPEVIVAAYETCEVAVDAWVLAQHLRAAARAQPRIELVMNAKVERVDAREGAYDVVFEQGGVRRDTGFQGVVNALWANRPAIDERSGLKPRGRWYTRRKLGALLMAPA